MRAQRLLAAFVLAAIAAGGAAAEPITIGIQKLEGQGPVYIAQEKGYFRAEGLDAQIVYFSAAQPIAVGVVSGDLDFAVAGFGAGFYNLAGQGALRIIAAYVREAPSFQATAYVISNRAYAEGFTSLKDFAGKSVAVMQVGSSQHYALGRLAEKYGFDLKSVRVVAVQSGANEATAVVGGQVDAAVVPETYVKAALAQGEAKLLGWVGDETPWQLGASSPRRARRTTSTTSSCVFSAPTRKAWPSSMTPSLAPMSAGAMGRPRPRCSPSSANMSANWSTRCGSPFPITTARRGSTSRTCCTRSPGTRRKACSRARSTARP